MFVMLCYVMITKCILCSGTSRVVYTCDHHEQTSRATQHHHYIQMHCYSTKQVTNNIDICNQTIQIYISNITSRGMKSHLSSIIYHIMSLIPLSDRGALPSSSSSCLLAPHTTTRAAYRCTTLLTHQPPTLQQLFK